MSGTTKPRIVFLDAATVSLDRDVDLSPIAEQGDFTIYDGTSPARVAERCRDSDIVVVNKVRLDRELLSKLPSVKLICEIATGTDNIDTDAAREMGIAVSNVVGYGRFAVAQHTIALMLALVGRLVDYVGDVRGGAWDASPMFTLLKYPTFEVAGRTLGLVGFGAIAQSVARIAESLGMVVRVHTRSGIAAGVHPGYKAEPLDHVLRSADVVSLHVPLTHQTKGMIGAAEIASMKQGSYLINTSRGGIVDEEAALEGLMRGQLAGAAFDVLQQEPPRENPLTQRTDLNLIVTPHAAWSAREARQRLVDGVAENIRAWTAGNPVPDA